MKPLAFITSAIAAGLLLGFAIVATVPDRTTPATAKALGKPLPDLVGQSLDDATTRCSTAAASSHETTDQAGLIDSLFGSDRIVCQTNPSGPDFVSSGQSVELVVDSYC